VSAVIDNLRDGASVDDFVAWFPGVSVAQARTVFEHASHSGSMAG
jgi:uncharacterized protein (DUF433 family)